VDVRLDRSGDAGEDIRGTREFAAYRHEIWTLLREQRSTPHAIKVEVASVA
jgi:hypothetical protein